MATDNLIISQANTIWTRSVHDYPWKESRIVDKLYKMFGDGFNTLDILRSLNRWDMVSNESMKANEEGYDHRTITIGASVTVDSDNQVRFDLDADDVDTLGNYYPRVGFTITFGDTNRGFTQGRITAIAAGGANVILTVNRYDNSGAAPTFTNLNTWNLLITGTEVAICDSAFGVETGQPNATSMGVFEREFKAQIFKETIIFGGMELAKQKWITDMQGNAMFNAEMIRAEFGLDRQIECALIFGQSNEAALTQTSSVSGTATANTIGKIKGVYTWIDELGGELNYTLAGGMDITDWDEVAAYMESQGVPEGIILVLGGGAFISQIEQCGLDLVKGTSGGLNVTFTDSEVQSMLAVEPNIRLNIGFQAFKKRGYLFLFRKLPILTNPYLFGIAGYMLNDSAIMFPISTVKDAKSGVTVPNLRACYVGIDGYSRKRVVGHMGGMDGYLQQRFGMPTTTSIDANYNYWLAHLMFPFMEANKGMLFKRIA
jgi:hypothetical protein